MSNVFQPKQRKESVCMRIELNSRGISWGHNNMAAVPLFRDTTTAAVTSRENTLSSVSTHVINALTTVAIRHIGVQTNTVLKADGMK